jgi:hypothetical protein
MGQVVALGDGVIEGETSKPLDRTVDRQCGVAARWLIAKT